MAKGAPLESYGVRSALERAKAGWLEEAIPVRQANQNGPLPAASSPPLSPPTVEVFTHLAMYHQRH